MTERTEWEKKAANLLKAEMIKKDLSYDGLKQALESIGVHKTTPNLNKTINLGKFPFAFFLQCAKAIGLRNLRLDELFSDEIN